MTDVQIKTITYTQTHPLWSQYLWSKDFHFDPISAMLYMGGYDGTIEHKYRPTYLGAVLGSEILGVVSGHKTSEVHYRSRGLVVKPEYQRMGLATALLKQIIHVANAEYCQLIWTAPRESSWGFYKKIGFIQDSQFVNDGFAFGPNCFASIKLENKLF